MRLLCYLLLFIIATCQSAYTNELFKPEIHRKNVTITGFTQPAAAMTIASEISGKVSEVHVDVGDTIGIDGKVAQIDTTFILLDIEANNNAQLQNRIKLKNEKKNLKRLTTLITKNSTAQANFDNAVLRTELLEIEGKILLNTEKKLYEKLRRHTITAPSGWTVSKRFIETGEFLQTKEPAVEVGNYDRSIVAFLLSYEELSLLKEMEEITIHLPELETTYNATLKLIYPEINSASRKVKVELNLLQPDRVDTPFLQGGLKALLTIQGQIDENLYVVPAKGIKTRYGTHWLTDIQGNQIKVIIVRKIDGGEKTVITGNNISQNQSYKLF